MTTLNKNNNKKTKTTFFLVFSYDTLQLKRCYQITIFFITVTIIINICYYYNYFVIVVVVFEADKFSLKTGL